jgi:hypothetical protein
MIFIDNTVSPSTGSNHIRISKFDFPRCGKIGITSLIFRLFLRRLLLIALLLDPLNFVLARTRLRKFVFT